MSRLNIAKFQEDTKVWKGSMGNYPHPLDKHLAEIILEAFDKNPERIVQINHDEGTTWIAKDLKIASIRAAQNFMKLGIKPDDIIGFNIRNSAMLNPLVIGTWFAGAITSGIHVSFNKETIKQLFGQTKPKIVFCDSDRYEETKQALAELENPAKVYTLMEKLPGISFFEELLTPTGIEDKFEPLKFDETSDKKLIAIIFSSGTTSAPKGVRIPCANFVSFLNLIDHPTPPFSSINFSSFYWGSGFSSVLNTALSNRETRISTSQEFSIDLLVEIVEKYKPKVVYLPPAYLDPFLKSPKARNCDFSSVKVVVSIGTVVREKLRQTFKETFPNVFLSTFYAMTEAPCTYTFPGDSYDGLTVGKISGNIFLKIVNENGENVGYHEQGEIRVKFEFGFPGYLNNPEATAAALDEEGYYKTGDIGFFDKEANLFVVDRIKEIFKHKRYQIWPGEIENFMIKIKGIAAVAVVGIPDPDFPTDLPAAVIVKEKGFDHLTAEDIKKEVASNFPEPKHLEGGVYFADELPMTTTGKVKKLVVREMASKLLVEEREKRKALD